jgi:predicted ATPase
MDVVVWLRGLGLGKYEAAFRENEIDETVLPGLTAEDLKELGVAALGHRRKLLDAIAALRSDTIPGLARQRPVLMIVEDAHWVDPTSLEVFGRTVDQIKTLPVLLIVTFRPEFNAPWAGRSHVTSLALNRLGERETAAIITHLVGNKELPADVMAEIVERTDGIPLFVEEMTKAVLEAESEGEARRTGWQAQSLCLLACCC